MHDGTVSADIEPFCFALDVTITVADVRTDSAARAHAGSRRAAEPDRPQPPKPNLASRSECVYTYVHIFIYIHIYS